MASFYKKKNASLEGAKMDITPFLNRDLNIPLYQQLYRHFKENMHQAVFLKD